MARRRYCVLTVRGKSTICRVHGICEASSRREEDADAVPTLALGDIHLDRRTTRSESHDSHDAKARMNMRALEFIHSHAAAADVKRS